MAAKKPNTVKLNGDITINIEDLSEATIDMDEKTFIEFITNMIYSRDDSRVTGSVIRELVSDMAERLY